MFNSIKLKVLVISLSTAALLIGFQNCSKVKIGSEDVSGLNNGLSTDEIPDNTQTPINQPPVGSGTNPPGSSTNPPPAEQPIPGTQPIPPIIAPLPPPGGTPPPAPGPVSPPLPPEEQECVDYALDHEKKDNRKNDDGEKDDDDDNSAKVDVSCKKEEQAKQMPKCGVKPEEDDSEEDLEQICAGVKTNGAKVLSPETVGSSKLEEFKKFRGKLVICDMEIKNLTDTRGKIIVVRSHIENWTKQRGRSIIIQSSVEHCIDHRGSIGIQGGRAVCSDVSGSSGVIKIKRQK